LGNFGKAVLVIFELIAANPFTDSDLLLSAGCSYAKGDSPS